MIIIDDGSTDDSLDIWRSYQDTRVRVLQNETNMGTYGTQNRAVSLANSDLISVLNSDDFWEPSKLELQLKLLDKSPEAPFCYTLGWHADENGDLKAASDNYVGWPVADEVELLPYLLDFNRLHASSVIWRKRWAVFEPKYNTTGDWIASIRAAYSAPVACVTERVSHWRIHSENTSGQFRSVTKGELQIRSSIVRNLEKWLLPRVDAAIVRERVGQCAYHLCALEMLWGRKGESRRTSRTAYHLMQNKKQAARRMLMCHMPRFIAAKRFFPQAAGKFCRSEIDSLEEIPWKLTRREEEPK
jgi:hypothetical protein